jgi:CheY-like chemotaxis protein
MVPVPATAPPSCAGILIVEDDFEIRTTLKEVLQDEGYDVAQASNGLEALKTLEALKAANAGLPCLILLDLMMPLMDGWQFRDAQLKDERLTDIPVVVLSADGNARQKAAAMNVAKGLPKPVRLEVLLSTIAEYC